MVAESSRPNRVTPLMSKKIQSFPPLKMSASLIAILLSDEEDARICEHKVMLEREKWAKEE